MTVDLAKRVFNPSPPPICEKCDLPLGFILLDSGKWRPCNPNGSDHWDVCRDIRYAKAKMGECREETWTDERNVHRRVYWDGGEKPFFVLHSTKAKRKPKLSGDGGLLSIEQHQAHATKHNYTVREV